MNDPPAEISYFNRLMKSKLQFWEWNKKTYQVLNETETRQAMYEHSNNQERS